MVICEFLIISQTLPLKMEAKVRDGVQICQIDKLLNVGNSEVKNSEKLEVKKK